MHNLKLNIFEKCRFGRSARNETDAILVRNIYFFPLELYFFFVHR